MSSQEHYLNRLQELLERSNEYKPGSKNIDLLFWKLSQIRGGFAIVEDVAKLTNVCLQYVDLVLKYSDTLPLEDLATKACKNRIMRYMSILSDIGNITSIKNLFVENITVPLLERILDPCIKIICGKELIKNFNTFVQNSDKIIRAKIVESSSRIYFYKLADVITSCGDYEYQTALLETIFRMCMKETINKYAFEFFPETESLQCCLVKIDVNNFDKSIRLFLNTVNKIYRNVFSIEAKSATLDHMTIAAPLTPDGNREALWIDFNLQSETIGIYCDRRSLNNSLSMDSDAEFDIYELITIFTKDVSRVQLTSVEIDSKRGVTVKFYLTVPCHVLHSTSEETSNSKQLTLLVYNTKTVKLLKNDILPLMFHDKFKGPKCSSAQLMTSTEDSYYSAHYLVRKPVYKPLMTREGKSKTVISEFSDGRSMKSLKSTMLLRDSACTNGTPAQQISSHSSPVSKNQDNYYRVGKYMQMANLEETSIFEKETTINSDNTYYSAKVTNSRNDKQNIQHNHIRKALHVDEIIDLTRSDKSVKYTKKTKRTHIRQALSVYKENVIDTAQYDKPSPKYKTKLKQSKFKSKSYEKLSKCITSNFINKSKSLSNLSRLINFQPKNKVIVESTNRSIDVAEKINFLSWNTENSLATANIDTEHHQKANGANSVLGDVNTSDKLNDHIDGTCEGVIQSNSLENIKVIQGSKCKEKFKVKLPVSKQKKLSRNDSPLISIAETPNEEQTESYFDSANNNEKSTNKVITHQKDLIDGTNENIVYEISHDYNPNTEPPKVIEKEKCKNQEENEIYNVAKETVLKHSKGDYDIVLLKPAEICQLSTVNGTSMTATSNDLNNENKLQDCVTSEFAKKCDEIGDISLQNMSEDMISCTDSRTLDEIGICEKPEKHQAGITYHKIKKFEKPMTECDMVNNEIYQMRESQEFQSPIIYLTSEHELNGKQSFIEKKLTGTRKINLLKENTEIAVKDEANEDMSNVHQYVTQKIVKYDNEEDFVRQHEDQGLVIETIEYQTEKNANELEFCYKECKDSEDKNQRDKITETIKGEDAVFDENQMTLDTKQCRGSSNRKRNEEVNVKSEENKELQNEERRSERGMQIRAATQENKGTNMQAFSEDDEIQNCQVQYFREKSKSCDKARKMKENQSKIKRQGNKDTDVKCNVKEMQNKEPLKQITLVNVIETVVNDEIQDSKDTFTYRDQIKSVNKICLSKPKKLQTDLNTKSSSNGEILQYREEIKEFNKDYNGKNSLSQDAKDKSKYYDKSELLMKTRSRTKKLQGDDGTESLSNLGNARKSLKEENIEIITEKVELADAQDQDSTDKLRCHGKIKPVKLKKSRTKKRENVHDTEFSSDAEVTQNKEPLIEKNTKMSTKNVEVTDGQDQDSKDEFRCYDKIIAVKKKSKTKKQQNDHDSELSSYAEVAQNKESLKTENIEMITENVEIMDDQVEDFKDRLQRPQKVKPIKKTRSRTKKRQGDCDTKLSSNVEGVENKESSIDENTQMLTEKFQCYVNIKTMKTNLTSKELQSDLNTESTNNFGKPLKELYRNIDEMNSRDKHKNCDIMKAIKKKRTRKLPNCEDTESSIDLIEGTPKIDTTKTQSHTMKSSDDDIATLIMQVTTPTLESHIRNGNQLNQNAKISKENSQLLGICNDFNGNEISMKENVHLLSENDILERSYITHIMQKQSNKTQNIEVKKQLYDVATELVLSQSRRNKKEEQNQSYKSTTVQERLSQSDTTLFIKPKQKKVRTLFNENDQSYLDAINYDIDSVEAKIFEISQREAEQDYKVPLKRTTRIRKQTKVMKRKMSDSDSDIPRPIITSALVHASQAGELSTIKNVATQQCVQIKKINDDLDIVQVDNSTQLNEIAIRKPLNLPTSLTTLNKPGKEEASTNWEFKKVRNLPNEATNEVKEVRKSKGEDFKKRSNEDYVHRKPKKAINLRNQQGPSISKNKSKRYSRKQKFEEPEKKRRKMNTTHVKRTNSTKHNSNKANKKDRERQLEFSRFMTDFLEDVELTRTGDYSKSDMLLRGAREYDCESIDSDVPLAKIRKRKRLTPTKGELCHQLFDSNSLSNKSIGALGINTRAENIKKNNRKIIEQLHDPDDINDMGLKFAARDEPFLQISKRSKLKEISSKSVDSQKTELSSLPELYIEKTKKQDYILLYTSSPSDEIGLPRCEQPGNSIEEIINKSPQGHNTKSEMIEKRSDKSSKNTNSQKLLSSYIKLEKLKQPTLINNNNSVSNSIFEQETVTKLIQAKSECLQNGDRSNTLTDSKKVKIKILQNILLRPQHVSEVNSHGSENQRSNNVGGVVTQLTPQTIASWICTGNTESQISQRLLEVLLQFFNNATKIVLEDMKGPIPPHLLELFETFSELDASLDKLFSK